MCRVLTYLGRPILLDTLLYNTDSSLIIQSYNPKLMTNSFKNLAGFGIVAWDKHSHNPQKPFIYRIPTLPFYDGNLKNLSSKVESECVLAHVRGVGYSESSIVSMENVHPFLFENTNIAFAHNGNLTGFAEMRYDLAQQMKPEYKIYIKGTTDSEWMYALFLSRLKKRGERHTFKEIHEAIISTLEILKKVRKKNNISLSSPLNFFISDGNFIAAMRYTMDFGHYSADKSIFYDYSSLWYTYGDEYGYFDDEYKMKGGSRKNSIIIASEPLTDDYTTWIEVPEYSFIIASLEEGGIQIQSVDMEV